MKKILGNKPIGKLLSVVKNNTLLNTSQLARKLNKGEPTTYKQLKILEKNKFVLSFRNKNKNSLVWVITNKGKLLLDYFKEDEKLRNKYEDILSLMEGSGYANYNKITK